MTTQYHNAEIVVTTDQLAIPAADIASLEVGFDVQYLHAQRPTVTSRTEHRTFYSIHGERLILCITDREARYEYNRLKTAYESSIDYHTFFGRDKEQYEQYLQRLTQHGIQQHTQDVVVYTMHWNRSDYDAEYRQEDFLDPAELEEVLSREYTILKEREAQYARLIGFHSMSDARSDPALQTMLRYMTLDEFIAFRSEHFPITDSYIMQCRYRLEQLFVDNPKTTMLHSVDDYLVEYHVRLQRYVLQAIHDTLMALDPELRSLPLQWSVLPVLEASNYAEDFQQYAQTLMKLMQEGAERGVAVPS